MVKINVMVSFPPPKAHFLIPLSSGRRLLLRKGHDWRDSYLQSIVLPLLKGIVPPGVEQIASSKNAQAWKVRVEEGSFFVKFFKPRGIKDTLAFRSTRSRRAMQGDHLLSEHGFLTPTIIVQGDIVKRLRVFDNFIISQWIDDACTTYTYMRTFFVPPLSGEQLLKKRSIIAAAGKLIGRLHQRGIFHGDLRPGNVLIRESDKGMLFFLIDNERTKYFPSGIPFRLRIKNLVQICMIVMPQVTFTDRLRFFKAYMEENPELKPIAKRLIRKVFLKAKQRLAEKLPGIWER
ncbi:MAG: lipopolysaccharide kinase InaA family protein [Nitrospirota bacterium]